MKLLIAGVLIGLVLGVMLTLIYFSLATFFGVNSRRNSSQKTVGNSSQHSERRAVVRNMRARAAK